MVHSEWSGNYYPQKEPALITTEAFIVQEQPHITQVLSPLSVMWGCSLAIKVSIVTRPGDLVVPDPFGRVFG